MPFWTRFSKGSDESSQAEDDPVQDAARFTALEAECRELHERLRESERLLRERTEALYALQQTSSTEHFGFSEAAQLLKIERLRNAGAYAQRDVILERAKDLQARIATLKDRLRVYETVDDLHFDAAPLMHDEE